MPIPSLGCWGRGTYVGSYVGSRIVVWPLPPCRCMCYNRGVAVYVDGYVTVVLAEVKVEARCDRHSLRSHITTGDYLLAVVSG